MTSGSVMIPDVGAVSMMYRGDDFGRVRAELAEAGAMPPLMAPAPDDLAGRVREVLAHCERLRAIAAAGPDFGRNHHGSCAADVLRPFLIGA